MNLRLSFAHAFSLSSEQQRLCLPRRIGCDDEFADRSNRSLYQARVHLAFELFSRLAR
jgi:hypothetical protein